MTWTARLTQEAAPWGLVEATRSRRRVLTAASVGYRLKTPSLVANNVNGLEVLLSKAVLTPGGVYCEDCLPDVDSVDAFTLYGDTPADAFPRCVSCGRVFPAPLTMVGERFEAEIAGPQPGDTLLTRCGPADTFIEMSECEGSVIGVYQPKHGELLQRDIDERRANHPHAHVWTIHEEGYRLGTQLVGEELDPLEVYINRQSSSVLGS